MKHAFYLAVQSLCWYRGRALTIVLCLALTLWLPITVRMLLTQFRTEITARAGTTPLVIGAAGIDTTRRDVSIYGRQSVVVADGTQSSA